MPPNRLLIPPPKKLIVPEGKRVIPPPPKRVLVTRAGAVAPSGESTPPPKKINIIVKKKPVFTGKPTHILNEASQPRSLDENCTRILEQMRMEAETMSSPEIRDAWVAAITEFETTGNVGKLMDAVRYRRTVVPMDEFLFGKAYLGLKEGDIFKSVLDSLIIIDSDTFHTVVLTGAIGGGKTYTANIGMARSIYKGSCMRSPHDTYGIADRTAIAYTIQSVRQSTARKAVFDEFGKFIDNSPYFQRFYPRDPLIKAEMIFPEHGVRVLPVSSSQTAAISMNVISGLLDEANFMQKITKSKSSQADEEGNFDQARQLFNTLVRRRQSRFLQNGRTTPGAMYLVSSSRLPTDFTEEMAAKSAMRGGTDAGIYVRSTSQWEARGREKFSSEEFRVVVGDTKFRTRVLSEGEPAPIGATVINVPMDFHQTFLDAPNDALRDIAGRTTRGLNPFFARREMVSQSMSDAAKSGYLSIFGVEQVDLHQGIPFIFKHRARLDVHSDRHIHVDLGLTKDAAGISCGHIAGYRVTEHRDEDNQIIREVAPVVAYDFILRIVPPGGGEEIDFSAIRQLISTVKTKTNLPIKSVSYDGFNSVDSRQILRKQGFSTDYLSVEPIEPWEGFRDALYDGRLLMCNHNFLAGELADVMRVPHGTKEKVDHPPGNGTKDVADSAVGVYKFLMSRRSSWAYLGRGARPGLHLYGTQEGIRSAIQDSNVDATELYRPDRAAGTFMSARKRTDRKASNRKGSARK